MIFSLPLGNSSRPLCNDGGGRATVFFLISSLDDNPNPFLCSGKDGARGTADGLRNDLNSVQCQSRSSQSLHILIPSSKAHLADPAALRHLAAPVTTDGTTSLIYPLGCIPRVMCEALASRGLDTQGGVYKVHELSLDYNISLLAGFSDLNSHLLVQGSSSLYIDLQGREGFADEKRACCGLGCMGDGGLLGGCFMVEMVCEEPSRRVWWDLYNMMSIGNKFMANYPETLVKLILSSSLVD
ncbi:unnamed protein product [Spirodela intermedia]|uniref:Uncharacterized protein n=1 Tax=Spirodela intermedia TaxID=51605 RepID=A0ABN7EAB2_SPIIN|nr:unnamed protein product [Spirodela intermedia]